MTLHHNEINHNINITTQRLSVRNLTEADAQAILEILSDREVTRFLSIPAIDSIKQAKEFILQAHRGFESGSLLEWGVEDYTTGQLIGFCCYHNWNRMHKRAEIGFALGKKFWGQGYMTELLQEFIPFGFERLQLHRIEADVDPRNVASLKLLKRCGFKVEGHLRERYHQNGEIQDAVILGLLKHEVE
jgi:RimJ/RimL family protein N-acetyltransferase